MNLGDGGRIASIQPEEGVAQDGLSPCGNSSSLLRSTIPIPRKCAASQSLDVQHHREKQKLDHYITPENHRSYVKGFPKFPELPPEIRMQIFDYAGVAWGANNVYITCRRRYQPFQNTTSACHRAQGSATLHQGGNYQTIGNTNLEQATNFPLCSARTAKLASPLRNSTSCPLHISSVTRAGSGLIPPETNS
jgi:hypothetical protein